MYEVICGTTVGGTRVAKFEFIRFAQIFMVRSLSGRPDSTGDAAGEFVRRDAENIAAAWPNSVTIKLLVYEQLVVWTRLAGCIRRGQCAAREHFLRRYRAFCHRAPPYQTPL